MIKIILSKYKYFIFYTGEKIKVNIYTTTTLQTQTCKIEYVKVFL